MLETFTVNQRVYYVENGSSDTGTVVKLSGTKESMLPMYLVTWDNGDTPDWYRSSQLAPLHYMAVINTPGYLSEQDDPPVFETAREAWQYLVGEVERAWDDNENDPQGACVDAHTQLNCIDQNRAGGIHAGTPDYTGDHDLGVHYSVVETSDPLSTD